LPLTLQKSLSSELRHLRPQCRAQVFAMVHFGLATRIIVKGVLLSLD
jgi:hypothetical protein